MEIDFNDIINFPSENIIDLRSKDEYNNWHIKGSVNTSYNKILVNPENYLNKRVKYLLLCDYGKMSKKVCEILRKQGFLTFSLLHGIKKYKIFFNENKKN